MSFDEILNRATTDEKDALMKQALKKQEYNRNYQRRLRARAKLATLESRIDNNLQYVLGYIKRKYAEEYAAYVEPVQEVISPAFIDWFTMFAQPEYKSAKEAYDISSIKKSLSFDEFAPLFERGFKKNNKGKYIKD